MSATGIELTAPRCSPPSEISAPSAIRRIAENAATVKEAISARKKFIAPVMVPTCERATEFCSETTLIGNAVPRPSANTDRSTPGRNGCQRNQREPGLAGAEMINHLVIKRQMHGQSQYRAQREAAGGHRVRRNRSAHQRQRQERLFGISGMPDERQ